MLTFVVRIDSTNPYPEKVHAEMLRALGYSFPSVNIEAVEERKV